MSFGVRRGEGKGERGKGEGVKGVKRVLHNLIPAFKSSSPLGNQPPVSGPFLGVRTIIRTILKIGL